MTLFHSRSDKQSDSQTVGQAGRQARQGKARQGKARQGKQDT